MPEGSLDDYLPPDEFRRVADVRRALWTGGFSGAIGGSAAGLAAYYFFKKTRLIKVNRLHAIPFVAGSGAICAFVGSFAYGSTAMEHFDMHKVLQNSAERTRDKQLTTYQRALAEQEEDEERRQVDKWGADSWSEQGKVVAAPPGDTSGNSVRLERERTWQQIREQNSRQR